MPEEVSTSVSNAVLGELRAVSNALENMITPGFGPDQSHCRVNVCEYVSFDYNGTLKDDPIVAIHMNLSPLDGSNDNKDFDIEWGTGAKMSEFAIIDDGGKLAPISKKSALANNSNWALCLRSMADAAFNSATLDGPRGVHHVESMEWHIRRIKQPERSGLDPKTAKGRDKEYYTCLKIEKMPGEKGSSSPARRAATPKPAVSPGTSVAASASASNGTGATNVIQLIKDAVAGAGGSMAISDLAKAVFKAAKASGLPGPDCTAAGKSVTASYLDEQAFEQEGWEIADGTLTIA